MKKTLAKTLRSAFALVLALVMVLGTVGTTFAAAPSVDKNTVDSLIEKLKQYGPDVVEEARQYVEGHGYVAAVKETAAELKAAIVECANEHEFLIAQIEQLLAGPVAQLKELKADAENLVYLIALAKAGGFAGALGTSAAAVITVPGFGTIDTENLDLENFQVSDLTEDQKKAINDSGLLGDMKVEDLTDEQVEALKEAGLTGEINPEYFTEEELEQLQSTQKQLNETIKTIEKTQNTANALQEKVNALKAQLADLKEAAASTEDLSGAILSLLKQETVQGVEAVTAKYVDLRDTLFTKLAKIEDAYSYVDDLAIDVADMTLTLTKEVAELSAFVAKDLIVTVNNNKVLIAVGAAGAISLTAEKLGISYETQIAAVKKLESKLPLVKAAAEKVAELAKKICQKIYKAYKDATTADLLVSYDFDYVAIGETGYAELLNEALVNPYDYTTVDMDLIQDLNVAKIDELADADLITIGASGADFVGSMAEAMLGVEVDWSVINPKLEAGANEVVDEIVKYIDAMGVSKEIAKGLTNAIENYIYNAMAYAYFLPKTISAIRDINEDAVLVVVGLDNPLEDVVVSHNTRSLGLDALSSALVALTDVYSTAYAMLANNCTYVAAPNARNDFEGSEITVDNIVSIMDVDAMYPNAKGAAYIKNEIMDALNVSYGFLWGDANLDKKANYEDSLIICQYSIDLPVSGGFIYLPVCDVTGDGKANYQDALDVCRKSIQLIDKFEVEK